MEKDKVEEGELIGCDTFLSLTTTRVNLIAEAFTQSNNAVVYLRWRHEA